MGETYNDRHDSKIYGARLIIYRRGDVENASFTFRAKVAGQKGYIRRNTKADDPARAMVLAEQAYEELQVRKKSGLSLIQLSANAFFDEWINKQKTKLTASRWNWKRNCWDRYISSYLGHHNLADLTKKFVDGYWDHRTKFWTMTRRSICGGGCFFSVPPSCFPTPKCRSALSPTVTVHDGLDRVRLSL